VKRNLHCYHKNSKEIGKLLWIGNADGEQKNVYKIKSLVNNPKVFEAAEY
jgi:hypothetical protein